jgi:digeranylgeranylglycerophospholipid reductase
MNELGQCDLLVVGAGPAGCSAAIAASSEGIRTLLIDRKRQLGERPHCGEFVPRNLFRDHDLDPSCIVKAVDVMRTTVLYQPDSSAHASSMRHPDGGEYAAADAETTSPGYLIDRYRFDRDLARRASKQGSFVLSGTRFVSASEGEWTIRTGNTSTVVTPKYVVAADGPTSSVAKSLGIPRLKTLIGLQVEVPLVEPLEKTYIFLSSTFFGGYGWLFPKGLTANVGVGLAIGIGIRPGKILNAFLGDLAEKKLITEGCLAKSVGAIPISGLRPKLRHENVVFIGDAAGLTHPVTGAGVSQAVFSGELAGKCVSKALKTGKQDYLMNYETEIRARYQGTILHALSKRRRMIENWNSVEFTSLCRETWIAFDGYRKRIRD